jgi:hypothetical protein
MKKIVLLLFLLASSLGSQIAPLAAAQSDGMIPHHRQKE